MPAFLSTFPEGIRYRIGGINLNPQDSDKEIMLLAMRVVAQSTWRTGGMRGPPIVTQDSRTCAGHGNPSGANKPIKQEIGEVTATV